ncbi:MAG TPA: dTDP-4-dehydrorhamnose reductase [Burkholderiaceae bacterium]|nr:dTDP-4-dehydrorhamnose reductase [Burkholderiaceae bacterium]
MKILLFGCNGQVGWELQRSLAVLGEVLALGRDAAGNPQGLCGDLLDIGGLIGSVRAVRPEVIVNAAAYTAVDKAESEPAMAHAVNAQAPAALAEAAGQSGAWLVHYSSEHVFDGSGEQPWCETDNMAPVNVYGQSKRDGDRAVAQNPKHLILRTSWVHAARGDNFAKTILRGAALGQPLRVVDDQFGAPTSAPLLADVTAHVLRAAMARPALAGTYHCAAAGQTSWYAYACFVLAQACALGRPVPAGSQPVTPIPSSAYPAAARRPLNGRLSTIKLQNTFGLHLPQWQAGLHRTLQETLLSNTQ